ncbi:hypothetical protein FPOAC2_14136 [Fusarium poae]
MNLTRALLKRLGYQPLVFLVFAKRNRPHALVADVRALDADRRAEILEDFAKKGMLRGAEGQVGADHPLDHLALELLLVERGNQSIRHSLLIRVVDVEAKERNDQHLIRHVMWTFQSIRYGSLRARVAHVVEAREM